jgi:hypothetical protein
MYYIDTECKFCKKMSSESYPPSLAMYDVKRDEEGTNIFHDFVMKALCTDCYRKYKEEFDRVKSSQEKWTNFKTQLVEEIKTALPEWNVIDVYGFTDNIHGSGAPCIYVIVDQVIVDRSEAKKKE